MSMNNDWIHTVVMIAKGNQLPSDANTDIRSFLHNQNKKEIYNKKTKKIM